MSADFLAAESEGKCRAPFSGEGLFRRDAEVIVYAAAADLLTCSQQSRRGRPDGDLAVARYVPLLPASWPNGLAQCAHWLPIELPGNSGGLLVRCRSMAPRA